MGIPDNTRQTASNAVANMGNWLAVFSEAAGTTGANEAVGGNYGRRQCQWTPGTNGVNQSNMVNVPVAPGLYKEAGVFSAEVAGTFVGSDVFAGGNVQVSGQGASIDLSANITV